MKNSITLHNNKFQLLSAANLIIVLMFIKLLFCNSINAEVTVQGTIANQVATANSVSFDVYLTRTGSNDLYIGNADFAFTFNSVNFTNPAFEYIDESNILKNSNGTATTSYNENIVTDILPGNILVININQPAFSNQTQFNSRIAKVDNVISTHKIGRFTLSGISNPAGMFNLEWKTMGSGVNSNIQTLENINPWISSAATCTFINPANIELPVELISFTSTVSKNSVVLNWKTASEINNSGFEIERKDINSEWKKISSVQGAGTTNEEKEYSYSDPRLNTGKYKYRLKQIDFNGNYEYLNLANEVEVGVPDKFSISQNYPNPFNPTTKVNYDLQFDSKVSIIIYDLTGREVTRMVNTSQPAGYYTVQFNGSNLSSGIYFYNIIAEGRNKKFTAAKKMILMK